MNTNDEYQGILNELREAINELNVYRSIGTIEEFRAMKETYTGILNIVDNK